MSAAAATLLRSGRWHTRAIAALLPAILFCVGSVLQWRREAVYSREAIHAEQWHAAEPHAVFAQRRGSARKTAAASARAAANLLVAPDARANLKAATAAPGSAPAAPPATALSTVPAAASAAAHVTASAAVPAASNAFAPAPPASPAADLLTGWRRSLPVEVLEKAHWFLSERTEADLLAEVPSLTPRPLTLTTHAPPHSARSPSPLMSSPHPHATSQRPHPQPPYSPPTPLHAPPLTSLPHHASPRSALSPSRPPSPLMFPLARPPSHALHEPLRYPLLRCPLAAPYGSP